MVNEVDDTKAPLLEHLIELRSRLIRCVIGLVAAFVVAYFFAEHIYAFLMQPLADTYNREGARMIFTALHEVFFTYVKVAFFAALFVAFPFIAMQIWMFVAPGLYKHERHAFLPFLVLTPILFFAGGALVYYLIFPLAWKFFISFETTGGGGPGALPIQLEAKVNEYLALVMKLIFAFGISFELPLLLTLLARAGMATSKGLAEKRKYAIVLAFVAAAILTPPDPISQISLALPIIALYEVSIFAVRIAERRRAEREAAEEAAGGAGADEDVVDETDFNADR